MAKIWERRGAAVYDGNDCIALFDCDNRSTSEIEANASLAAAAPNMLEALRAIRKEARKNNPDPDEIWTLAKDAIAKAEGRP